MRYKFVIWILCAGMPIPGMAEGSSVLPPLNLDAKYTVAWNGITIGRILINAHEDETSYRMSVDTKTSGIAAFFKQERRVAETSGHIVGGGGSASSRAYVPARFASHPQGNEKGSTTLLTYDTHGHLLTRSREPEDDPSWRPPVSFAQANQATDPVTAGFLLRRQLAQAWTTHDTTIGSKTYDGSRLAEMTLTIRPHPVMLHLMEKDIAAIETEISRRPIAGYTPKELAKFAAGDPPIHFYFSADETHIPLKIAIDVFAGQLTGTLQTLN